jgi:hypothetical protein
MSEAECQVRAYLDAFRRLKGEVMESWPDRGGNLMSIASAVRSGQLERSGVISSGIEYLIHGNGCLLVDSNGAEVDFDFRPDGIEMFDPWRVRRYVESFGESASADLNSILLACQGMVASGDLDEPQFGWFSVI